MSLFDPAGVQNNQVSLMRTHAAHLPGKREALGVPGGADSFRNALIGSLDEVNSQVVTHEELSVRAIVDPDSVDAHDLTIAAAKASTSLSITRNVVDRVIQAYRDITNLR